MEYFLGEVTSELLFKGCRINRSQLFEMGMRVGKKWRQFSCQKDQYEQFYESQERSW